METEYQKKMKQSLLIFINNTFNVSDINIDVVEKDNSVIYTVIMNNGSNGFMELSVKKLYSVLSFMHATDILIENYIYNAGDYNIQYNNEIYSTTLTITVRY